MWMKPNGGRSSCSVVAPLLGLLAVGLVAAPAAEAQDFVATEFTTFRSEASPSLAAGAGPDGRLQRLAPGDRVTVRLRIRNDSGQAVSDKSFDVECILSGSNPVIAPVRVSLDVGEESAPVIRQFQLPPDARGTYTVRLRDGGVIASETGVVRYPSIPDIVLTNVNAPDLIDRGASSSVTALVECRSREAVEVELQAWLSADGTLDTGDTLIGTLTRTMSAGELVTLAIPVIVPAATPNIPALVIVEVGPTLPIAERIAENNIAADGLRIGRSAITRQTISSPPAYQSIVGLAGTQTRTLASNFVGETISSPFPFEFFGQTETQLRVAGRGALTVNGTTPTSSNTELGRTGFPNAVVALFWGFNVSAPAYPHDVYSRVEGVAPNRVLTVEYKDFIQFGSGTLSGQVRFFESSPTIELQYDQTATWPSNARLTIGIERRDGFEFNAVANDDRIGRPSVMYRFITDTPTIPAGALPTFQAPTVSLPTPVTVSVADGPLNDLRIESVSATGGLTAGATIQLEVDLSQRNTFPLLAELAVVVSEDSAIEPDDRRLSLRQVTLLPAATTTDSFSVTLPADLDPNAKLGIILDPDRRLPELDRSDNQRIVAGVDYVVTALPLGMPSILGQPGTVVHFEGAGGSFDNETAELALPFPVLFFGRPRRSLLIHVNGLVTFGDADSAVVDPLPDPSPPNDFIAPIWDDFVVDSTNNGVIASQFVGQAPSRVVVIEFAGLGLAGGSSGPQVTGQLRLHEGSGRIELRYPVGQTWTGVNATIGLEGPAGGVGYGPGGGLVSPQSVNLRFDPALPQSGPAPKAELSIESLSAPASAVAGSTLTVGVTVRNSGGVPAAPFRVVLFSSTDGDFDASDPEVGALTVAGVGAGATSGSVGATVSLPSELVNGTLKLFARVDADGVIAESREDDNLAEIPVVVGVGPSPDLTVSRVSLEDPLIPLDTLRPLRIDLANLGEVAPVTASGDDELRVSAFLDTGAGVDLDQPVAVVSLFVAGQSLVTRGGAIAVDGELSPGGVASILLPLQIPSTVTPGAAELVVIVDDLDHLTEGRETNNQRRLPITIGPPAAADLAALAASLDRFSLLAGESLSATFQIFNAGFESAGDFNLELLLARDSTLAGAMPLSTETLSAPAVGSSTGALTRTLTIPPGTAEGAWLIALRLDPSDLVGESDEANNVTLLPFRIQAPARPDLLSTFATLAPSVARPGETLFVDLIPANLGRADAAATTVTIRLSADGAIDGGDVVLATLSMPALAAPAIGDSLRASFVLPLGTAAGSWTIGLVLDDGDQIQEADESNNAAVAGLLQVDAAGPAPDLHVALDGVSTGTVQAGQSFSLDRSLVNLGGGSAATFSGGVYLSVDRVITADDQPLFTEVIAGLGAGASRTDTLTVTVPIDLVPGARFVGYVADTADAVAESRESNNATAGRALEIQTSTDLDLTCSPTTLSLDRAQQGDSVTVTFTVNNAGPADVSALRVGVYASADALISSDDIRLTSLTLAGLDAGQSTTQTVTLIVPPTLPAGAWSIGAVANDDGSVGERDLQNNGGPGAPLIVVSDRLVELATTSLSLTRSRAFPAESFAFSFSISNVGVADAGPFRVGLYASVDPIVTTSDTRLGDLGINGLMAGSSTPFLVSTATLPTLPAGPITIAAIADDEAVIDEFDELNNRSAPLGFTVRPALPSLSVEATSLAPGSALPGQTVTLTHRLRNDSPFDAGPFRVGLYLSPDPTITTSDILLGVRNVTGLTGGTVEAPFDLSGTIPGAAPGVQYLGVLVDDLADVAEEDRTDNQAVLALLLNPAGGLDLFVDAIQLSAGVLRPSAPITVSHRVINGSTEAAGAFRVGLYLSADAALETSDTLLTTRSFAGLAGATVDGPADIQGSLPAGLLPGLYVVGVIVDDEMETPDIDRSNNTALATIIVEPPLDVELVAGAASFATGASPRPNETLRLTGTIFNLGTDPSDPVRVTVYLSDDSAVTTTDVALASILVSGPLPGQSTAVQMDARIPPGSSPGGAFLALIVDDDETVPERDETNNAGPATTLTINAPAGFPDLAIDSLTAPATVELGAALAIGCRAVNLGGAPSGPLTVSLRLSSDPIIDTNDTELTAVTLGTLAAGSDSLLSLTASVPVSLSAGPAFVGLLVDPGDAVLEDNEANNASFAEAVELLTTTQLDLIASLAPSAQQASAGGTLEVTVAANNSGLLPAGASRIGLYLSDDAQVTTADILLGSVAIGAVDPGASSAPQMLTVTLPASLRTGVYNLAAIADDLDAVMESDETNNASQTFALVVSGAGVIELQAGAFSLSSGALPPDADLVWTLSTDNIGLDPAGPFEISLMLSSDAVIDAGDMVLDTRMVTSLAAGGTEGPTSRTVRLPASLTPGAVFLGAIVDSGNAIPEFNEANNISAGLGFTVMAPPPAIALEVEELETAPRVRPGAVVSVTRQVRNLGSEAAAGYDWTILLSADQRYDGRDIVLRRGRGGPIAGPGREALTTLDLTLPRGLPAGTWYLGLVATTDAARGGIESAAFVPVVVDAGRRPGDLDGDGRVTPSDIQAVINAALGTGIGAADAGDLDGDGRVTVSDVQRVIALALGGGRP